MSSATIKANAFSSLSEDIQTLVNDTALFQHDKQYCSLSDDNKAWIAILLMQFEDKNVYDVGMKLLHDVNPKKYPIKTQAEFWECVDETKELLRLALECEENVAFALANSEDKNKWTLATKLISHANPETLPIMTQQESKVFFAIVHSLRHADSSAA
ncbi:MAG: hypothetical protein ABW189_08735 [Rickettsiales bacterium]